MESYRIIKVYRTDLRIPILKVYIALTATFIRTGKHPSKNIHVV